MSVLLAAFLQAGAENRTMTVRSSDRIQSIDASFSYEIHVTHGNSRTVTVEYDPVYEEYMKVECSFGKLYLRMEKLPAKLRLSERMTLKVYMEMSKIKDIDMSGASSVTFDGAYDAEDLDIDLSGAARIGFLEVSGESLSLNSSGAANFELRGAFSEDIDMNLSGASNGYVSLKAPELEVDMSGASKLYVFGSYDSTDLHCSGAGNIEIEGDGDTLNLKLRPNPSESGGYRAGLWVRDSSAGIGTMTFFSPSLNVTAGLGHGIQSNGKCRHKDSR